MEQTKNVDTSLNTRIMAEFNLIMVLSIYFSMSVIVTAELSRIMKEEEENDDHPHQADFFQSTRLCPHQIHSN